MNDEYCDCSQGRFECTCNIKGPTFADLIDSGYLKPPPTVERPSDRRISKSPALGAPYGDDSTTWIELNALKWKLHIVETLALIGWCGFVLTLLGVL